MIDNQCNPSSKGGACPFPNILTCTDLCEFFISGFSLSFFPRRFDFFEINCFHQKGDHFLVLFNLLLWDEVVILCRNVLKISVGANDVGFIKLLQGLYFVRHMTLKPLSVRGKCVATKCQLSVTRYSLNALCPRSDERHRVSTIVDIRTDAYGSLRQLMSMSGCQLLLMICIALLCHITEGKQTKIPVVIDTDIGQAMDDQWSIAYILSRPDVFDVKLILTAARDTKGSK